MKNVSLRLRNGTRARSHRLLGVESIACSLLALTLLTGCPMDDDDSSPEAEGSAGSGGADAGSTGAGEAGSAGAWNPGCVQSEVGDDDPVERTMTLALTAADLPPQFVCLARFEADAEGRPVGDPQIAGGPFGVPDPADPERRRLVSGFPYGAIVPLTVRRHDRKFFSEGVAVGFVVDEVEPREFAGSDVDSETCKRAWSQARDQPGRQVIVRQGELPIGASVLVALTGCERPSEAPECAGGNNLRSFTMSTDRTSPATFEGEGALSLGIQVAHSAAYVGYEHSDIYLQPGRLEGDIPQPVSAPILLSPPEGLRLGQASPRAVGVRLEPEQLAATTLLVTPHGSEPCFGENDCATVVIPIDPFVQRYAERTGAAWSCNQVLTLFGRPPGAGEAPEATLRLGVSAASVGF